MAKRRGWYVDLFQDVYPERWFEEEDALSAARTQAEVDFIEQSLELKPASHVLDLCCGHGRHAIELARRGYQVTGVDLSARALRRARRAASEAGADIRWQRCDMRDVAFQGEFDGVINMFTSFGYLESEEEDRGVLERVRAALRPGGRFLIDFINRDWVIRRYQARDWRRAPDGSILLLERRWTACASSCWQRGRASRRRPCRRLAVSTSRRGLRARWAVPRRMGHSGRSRCWRRGSWSRTSSISRGCARSSSTCPARSGCRTSGLR